MKVKTPEIGGVCESLQGRDSGSVYVIINVEGSFVSVADGVSRKVENPKKKNLKHIRLLPVKAEEIAKLIAAGKPVYDHQIAYALREAAEKGAISEDNECQKAT